MKILPTTIKHLVKVHFVECIERGGDTNLWVMCGCSINEMGEERELCGEDREGSSLITLSHKMN